jgi:hypothetical protein
MDEIRADKSGTACHEISQTCHRLPLPFDHASALTAISNDTGCGLSAISARFCCQRAGRVVTEPGADDNSL